MELFLTENQILKRVDELAERINQDYRDKNITLLGVLKGSCIFIADIARKLKPETTIEFMQTKSYSGTTSTGKINVSCEPDKESITGKHILIIEDIIDTGSTLNFLIDYIQQLQPASIAIVTLLLKKEKSIITKINYAGFEIKDNFVVGYGMDYNEKYRNLRDIYILS